MEEMINEVAALRDGVGAIPVGEPAGEPGEGPAEKLAAAYERAYERILADGEVGADGQGAKGTA
jgi:hypothetical protein